MFWAGFATAMLLVAAVGLIRFLGELRTSSSPESAARRQAQEISLCAMRLEGSGFPQVALPLWLHLATRKEPCLMAELYLSKYALSWTSADEALLEAYQSLARFRPDDPGVLYKLGRLLHHAGRTAEAQEYWRRVLERNADGWKYRAEEDLIRIGRESGN